ncbi:MAG: hypothetical protein LBU98_01305 [Alistipes sp.]|jgi:hypothetical protein|nr:hypothetical protein [Alistipes sp.]
MVGKVIRDYMEGGAKKLTVPGFGTFMRRESTQGGGSAHGDVIFVDLLRGDDGTLSELVEDCGGYSELEAMARIDRWIFETRNAVERNGSAAIEGFGTLTVDHKGVYKFSHSPSIRPTKETAVQESLFGARTTGAGTRPSVKPDGDEKKDFVSHRGLKPSNAEPRESPGRTPQKGIGPTPKKRGQATKPTHTDTILIVAIIAAAIALVALIFGMSSSGMPFLSK